MDAKGLLARPVARLAVESGELNGPRFGHEPERLSLVLLLAELARLRPVIVPSSTDSAEVAGVGSPLPE